MTEKIHPAEGGKLKVLTPAKSNNLKKFPIKQDSAETLISQAIQKELPVETIEKLLAMRKELKAEWSKEQYDKAMADFQGECPVIKKDKTVMNKDGKSVRYKYAPIDSIVAQVKDTLSKNGLSYTIKVRNDGKAMTVVCRVTHKAGHSEDSEFEVPISHEEYMSDVQKFGARSTFAKRYAFCNAFGIMTGDDDDDAQSTIEEKKSTQPPPKSPPINSKVPPKALPAKTPPKAPPVRDIKVIIKEQLDILYSPNKLSTAAEYQEAARKLTQTSEQPGLELIEKNYDEINWKLAAIIKERAETKNFEKKDACKYSPVSANKLNLLRTIARNKMHLIDDKVLLEWLEFEYKIKLVKLEDLNVKQADQAIDYLLKLKSVEDKGSNFKGDHPTI